MWSIYNHSSETMQEIADNSATLVITSPQYNVGIKYDTNNDDMPEVVYFRLLKQIFKECYRILRKGGRICVNTADSWRSPYFPNHHRIADILSHIGFLFHTEIIWLKGSSATHLTTWGSWRSPSNPQCRSSHEFIMVFVKESFSLENIEKTDPDITAKEFEMCSREEWTISTSNTTDNRHPAPFPEELPFRLIKFFSYPNDLVIDPFCGSGTTIAVAKNLKRRGIGYDISPRYCDWATKRVETTDQKHQIKLR